MTLPNGHANGSALGADNMNRSAPPAADLGTSLVSTFVPAQTRELVALLEVPFDPSEIEWRVTNTSQDKKRGQIIPYADQRAYSDRLNALFTPAGWTRKYTVHTSANFQRSKDQQIVAKVFVTCDLTVFGIGSHSATGEEWADNENAGTSAEAQAFKRACSCFGLGRYLYHFIGTWVDLDGRKRPRMTPKLAGWATPAGWRQGLRPQRDTNPQTLNPAGSTSATRGHPNGSADPSEHIQLVRRVEAMARPLGKGLYRGLLKTVAGVWKPYDIKDDTVLKKLLEHMQGADRGLERLKAALEQTGPEALTAILRAMKLRSLDQVDSLETLHRIVVALEQKV